MQVSIREAVDACEVLDMTAGGQAEIADILFKYGTEEKEVRKLGII